MIEIDINKWDGVEIGATHPELTSLSSLIKMILGTHVNKYPN